jgi:hypothetical protein
VKGFDARDADEIEPGGFLFFDFLEAGVEVVCDDDVADDVEGSFFEGVAELDELPLISGIADKEKDLWTPEFDVF